MNSNKKLIISLSIMSIVAVIALVAVIGVLAAGQQTLTSMIKVSYVAKDVSATARANYYVGTSANITSSGNFETTSGEDTLVFNPTDNGDTAQSLNPPADMSEFEIYIGDKIAFEYIFQNTSNSTYINVGLKLGDVVNLNDNILVTYATSVDEALENKFSATSTTYTGVYIAPNSTVYTYIVLEIDDERDDAEFSANVNWNLERMSKEDYELVTFPGTIDEAGVLTSYTGSAKNVVIPEGVRDIVYGVFNGNETITSISIPSSVTNIGTASFSGCTSLTSVTIPSGVGSIGDSAFGGCTSLSSVTIPSGVTGIGTASFRDCTSLTTVTFGENSQLESIGEEAFAYCTSLASVSIQSSVICIKNCAFAGTPFLTNNTGVAIPYSDDANKYFFLRADTSITSTDSIANWDKVACIAAEAFMDCASLTSVTIPTSVICIENCAFAGCTSLTSIEIPSSVTYIAGLAFVACESLGTVTFAENSQLRIIGEQAFAYCTSLTSVEGMPSGVDISYDAFSDCPWQP